MQFKSTLNKSTFIPNHLNIFRNDWTSHPHVTIHNKAKTVKLAGFSYGVYS